MIRLFKKIKSFISTEIRWNSTHLKVDNSHQVISPVKWIFDRYIVLNIPGQVWDCFSNQCRGVKTLLLWFEDIKV